MNGVIQGSQAVLSFFKDAWIPFVCSTDVTLKISSTDLPIRTVGSGHWKNYTYQDISYSVSLSGTLMYDLTNWTGFDMTDNLLNFSHFRFRLVLTDNNGNIKSFQGYLKLSSQDINFTAGTVVKTSLSLTGNGELQYFDGLIPCDSLITSITVTGQTAADGIVHITYAITGAPYKVKYRVDGQGNYVYALVGTAITIPGLSLGSHNIEMIPVCMNGYEADNSTSQSFSVTQSLTCTAVVTGITVTTTTAVPIYTGTPSQYKYRIDGGSWVYVAITFVVPLGGLSVGSHTIEMVPICSNSVEGTGMIQPFSVASQPAQSQIAWSLSSWQAGNILQIYVNGITYLSTSTPGSGTIIVPTGASVNAILQANNTNGSHAGLSVQDTTLSTVLYSSTNFVPITFNFTWTASGDNYSVNGTITP